jgi:hypothetical protein
MGGNWTNYLKIGKEVTNKVIEVNPVLRKGRPKDEVYAFGNSFRLMGSYSSKSFDSEFEEKQEKSIHEFIEDYEDFLHEEYGITRDSCKSLVSTYG